MGDIDKIDAATVFPDTFMCIWWYLMFWLAHLYSHQHRIENPLWYESIEMMRPLEKQNELKLHLMYLIEILLYVQYYVVLYFHL